MKNKVLYSLLCMLFFISSMPIQKAHASEKETPTESNIITEGSWALKTRSLSPIPFTATLYDAHLSICCTEPNYDISITLTNSNGEVVWNRNVSAPETSYVSISLSGLPEGSYTIDITNDYGGHLQGTFQL